MYRSREEFRAALVAGGLLRPASVDGVYGRSATFERIARGVADVHSRAGAFHEAELMWFPPVMARDAYLRTGYLRSFPDLVGSIDTFTGGDREHRDLLFTADGGGDWAARLSPATVTLCSAACHPLFELLTGTVVDGGRVVELETPVFRHEPSRDPMRMQSFRQHEFVAVTDPDGAKAHRDRWVELGLSVLSGLGLKVEAEVASDPFFGRMGQMLSDHQVQTELKYELVVHATDEGPTAIASANCHLDHFGEPFGIRTADGAVAHTACVGFGLERITLALLAQHGLRPDEWPADVRGALWG